MRSVDSRSSVGTACAPVELSKLIAGRVSNNKSFGYDNASAYLICLVDGVRSMIDGVHISIILV